MARRRRRRGTSGLGRAPAKGRGKYCVMTRKGTGKKARSGTRCFTSDTAAFAYAVKQKPSGGHSSVLFYRRKRAS